MKALLLATFLVIACQAARADDSKPGKPAGKATPAVQLKQAPAPPKAAASPAATPKPKSTFSGTADDHNPFWPIGWVKTDTIQLPDNQAPIVPHAEDFTVTSILMGEPPLAVINGKGMAEGEVAQFPFNGQNVPVQLMAVRDGSVVLRWQNQNLIVPLHRNEALSPPDPSPAGNGVETPIPLQHLQ